jgi:hypothetical protein
VRIYTLIAGVTAISNLVEAFEAHLADSTDTTNTAQSSYGNEKYIKMHSSHCNPLGQSCQRTYPLLEFKEGS